MFNSVYNFCIKFFSKVYKKCKFVIDKIFVVGSFRRKRNSEGSIKIKFGVLCIKVLFKF